MAAPRAAYYGDKPALASASQAEAVDDAAALTAEAAEGETATGAEYDALLADVTEVRAQLNAALASLRAAGLMDT